MPARADLTELPKSMIVGRHAEYDQGCNIETRLDPHELENRQQHQYEVLSGDRRKPVTDSGMQPDDVTQTLWGLKDIERIALHHFPR